MAVLYGGAVKCVGGAAERRKVKNVKNVMQGWWWGHCKCTVTHTLWQLDLGRESRHNQHTRVTHPSASLHSNRTPNRRPHTKAAHVPAATWTRTRSRRGGAHSAGASVRFRDTFGADFSLRRHGEALFVAKGRGGGPSGAPGRRGERPEHGGAAREKVHSGGHVGGGAVCGMRLRRPAHRLYGRAEVYTAAARGGGEDPCAGMHTAVKQLLHECGVQRSGRHTVRRVGGPPAHNHTALQRAS